MTSKRRPIVSARLTLEEVGQWRILRKLYRKEHKTDAALMRHLIRQEFRRDIAGALRLDPNAETFKPF